MQSSQLTDQEAAIWQAAIDHYRKDEDIFAVVSQISDLAQADFLSMMIRVRTDPRYSERIGVEGFIYAKSLLMQYAASFASV